MRHVAIVILLTALVACNKSNRKNHGLPPDIKVVNYDSFLRKKDDGWFYKDKLFSGYMVEVEKDGRVLYQLPIIDGKENGLAKSIYNSGEKMLERNFVNGKKEGPFTQWWPNGKFRYLFQYQNDLFDGAQQVFFPSGKKREISHYKSGQKEGLQSTWDQEGILISNYTIKNKKLYGVISVESCIPPAH